MKYNLIVMRRELESLGFRRRMNPFMWEEKRGVDERLAASFPYGRAGNNHINDLAEYCWHAYEKSYKSQGVIRIGRVGDVWRKDIFNQYAIAAGDNLWSDRAQGNILLMDKWVGVLNDAWLLGDIKRYASFHLMSYLSPANLWNHQQGYHIVTAREILGLLHFGYEMIRQGDRVIFECRSRTLADNASLRSYAYLMKNEQARGPASITRLLKEPVTGHLEKIHSYVV